MSRPPTPGPAKALLAAAVWAAASTLSCREAAPCDPSGSFVDGDGDGYGGETATACEGPLVLRGGDCDDGDADAHPAGAEVCNRIDDDCDGIVDENAVDATVFAFDADADGHGDPARTVQACGPLGGGYVAAVDDCDDLRIDVHPGASEVPYDGIDQDCDPTTRDDDLDGDGFDVAADCNDVDAWVTPTRGVPTFADVSTASGLSFVRFDGTIVGRDCAIDSAGGAAVADVDGDGDDDLFVGRLFRTDQLFINRGGTFVDEAATRGIDHAGTTASAVFFDAEGDGDRDLFVGSAGAEPARFYRNDGTGTFAEDAARAGLALAPTAEYGCAMMQGTAAVDLDGDGDLDLVVGVYRFTSTTPTTSRVLLNDGTGAFAEVANDPDVRVVGPAAFSPGAADLDEDGVPELAVVGDFGTSAVYRIARSPLRLTLAGVDLGVGTEANGMGSDFADVDGDGDLDWFVTSIFAVTPPGLPPGPDGNRLYRNEGDRFTDVTDAYGVRDGGWGWGAAFVDIDDDGDPDLVHENGYVPVNRRERARLFLNDGSLPWHEVGCRVPLPTIDARSVVPLDLEGDGDLDLVFLGLRDAHRTYRHDGTDGNAAVEIALRDTKTGNVEGVGADVYVQPDVGGPVTRHPIHLNVRGGVVLPARARRGVGARVAPLARVTVRWPDGEMTEHLGLPSRGRITLTR